MSSFRQRLLDEMVDVPTVDCHSHTMLRREYEAKAAEDRNLFTMTTYFRRDEGASSRWGTSGRWRGRGRMRSAGSG